ncbi:MAG: Hpt domain-containing protein [Oligoflexus sp.]
MLVEVDKELQDVFPIYIRNRQEDLMNMEASLGRMDFDVLKQIGHKFAGNADGYGLKVLGDLARDLEAQAKERNMENCSQIVEKMKTYIKEIQLKFV